MRTAPVARVSSSKSQPRPRLLPLLLGRADRFMAGPVCHPADSATSARKARKLLWLEGLLSNASESFVANFITPFALACGATNAQIGGLSSATNVASAVGLLPGARLEEHFGCRKSIFMLCTGVFGRLLLLALALLPLFFHLFGTPGIFYGLLAIVALRSFLNQLAYPAWSALVTDLVPESIRGRYFGSRNIAVGLAALVCTPLAGYLIQHAGTPGGYQVSFGIALATGIVATVVFGMIQEPKRVCLHEHIEKPPREIFSLFRRHPHFAAFTGLAFFWHLSLQSAGPFFAVYQMKSLGANVAHIGILSSIGAFTGMVGQRVWGVQNDRRGAVWVLRITGFLIPAIPAAWALIPNWWYLPVIEGVSGFIWAGYWLANFNLLLRMSPDANRSRFVALHQSVVSVASFIGPVLGGIIVNMVSIKGLFWTSAAGRFGVSLLFLFLIASDRNERQQHEA
ncbi:MAG: Major Facilitator Superfamily protein [Syntrophorhabdaceae bacterium PtaU1.Bin034]|nr:MAG: Major Facilitator Superfamily protein [Syntrophorhabdaceae bacterium PtaU1.Bin034]